MLYLDLRLGNYLSEARLDEANQRRQKAVAKRRLSQRLGRTLTVLGEKLENPQARAA